jgi:hypothetical protein
MHYDKSVKLNRNLPDFTINKNDIFEGKYFSRIVRKRKESKQNSDPHQMVLCQRQKGFQVFRGYYKNFLITWLQTVTPALCNNA